jgi:hypothetical protein
MLPHFNGLLTEAVAGRTDGGLVLKVHPVNADGTPIAGDAAAGSVVTTAKDAALGTGTTTISSYAGRRGQTMVDNQTNVRAFLLLASSGTPSETLFNKIIGAGGYLEIPAAYTGAIRIAFEATGIGLLVVTEFV